MAVYGNLQKLIFREIKILKRDELYLKTLSAT